MIFWYNYSSENLRMFMKLIYMLLFPIWLFGTSIPLPQNFTAHFKQIITNPKKKVITYTGTLRFTRPSSLKWLYQKPNKKEVCVKGHALTMVDYDLEQVVSLSIDKEFDFIKILKRAKLHHKNVFVSQYKSQKYTIQLNKQKQIESVAYFDNLDNKVQIVFTQVHYGENVLSASSMQCKIPKNFDMIQ